MAKSKAYGKQINLQKIYVLPTMKKKIDRLGNQSYKYLLDELHGENILSPIPFDNKIRESIKKGIVIPKGRGISEYKKLAEKLLIRIVCHWD